MINYLIIPAHLKSKRIENKLLLEETGKPLIQHTWENCLNVPNTKTIIATGDDKIKRVCESFGATVHYDSQPYENGTERVVNAALHLKNYNIVVNVQGEWPNISTKDLESLIEIAKNSHYSSMASLFYKGTPNADPNLVKVVVGEKNKALYFSRELIPHNSNEILYHIGVYALNKQLIQEYKKIKYTDVDCIKSENLEQLKVLSSGFPIIMQEGMYTYGIDTLLDYERFKRSQR